jgi:hypothetical protein
MVSRRNDAWRFANQRRFRSWLKLRAFTYLNSLRKSIFDI